MHDGIRTITVAVAYLLKELEVEPAAPCCHSHVGYDFVGAREDVVDPRGV